MPDLTIGMPTYQDFDGVYFTIQALRLNHDVSRCEFLVVDNYGCDETRKFITDWVPNGSYIRDKTHSGTAYAKNLIFEHAKSPYVLCLDCHVLLQPGALPWLLNYYKKNPDSQDLIQGPMYYDNLKDIATHMDPIWRGQMFGIWAYDQKVQTPEPFEIPLHGMGLFSSTRASWPGFHPLFRGFGGEEGYIHAKYRKKGARCLCAPQLGWVHRFGRPRGVPYPLLMEHKVKNYFMGHIELEEDLGEIYTHFREFMDLATLQRWEHECRQILKASLPLAG